MNVKMTLCHFFPPSQSNCRKCLTSTFYVNGNCELTFNFCVKTSDMAVGSICKSCETNSTSALLTMIAVSWPFFLKKIKSIELFAIKWNDCRYLELPKKKGKYGFIKQSNFLGKSDWKKDGQKDRIMSKF